MRRAPNSRCRSQSRSTKSQSASPRQQRKSGASRSSRVRLLSRAEKSRNNTTDLDALLNREPHWKMVWDYAISAQSGHDSLAANFCERVQSLKNRRANLKCANIQCDCLVHPKYDFGGYCCKWCHWRHVTNSKGKKKHGEKCLQSLAVADAERALPLPPEEPLQDVAGRMPDVVCKASLQCTEPALRRPARAPQGSGTASDQLHRKRRKTEQESAALGAEKMSGTKVAKLQKVQGVLVAAITAGNTLQLRRALDSALAIGFVGSTLQDATDKLKLLQEAKEGLTDASCRGDVALLSSSLDVAAKCGLSDDEIETARKRLAILKEARHLLRAACDTGEISEMCGALDAAEALGLSDVDQEEARKRLAKFLAAKEELVAAMTGGDTVKLQLVLRSAESIGLTDDLVGPAADQLRKWKDAAHDLDAAMSQGNVLMLEQAVLAAMSMGLMSTAVESAEAKLETLHSAKEALISAVKKGEIALVESALSVAEDSGLVDDTIHAAFDHMRRLKEVFRNLEVAMRNGDIATLGNALSAAEKSGLVHDLIHEASSHLSKLTEAFEALDTAMESGDTAVLERAVSAAEDCGLVHDLIHAASEHLKKLRDVSRTLDVAMGSGKIAFLQQAISAAKDAGLADMTIESGRVSLHKLCCMRESLIAASRGGNISALRSILKSTQDNGFDDESWSVAHDRLVELEAANTMLLAVSSGGDIEALQKALCIAEDKCLIGSIMAASSKRLAKLVEVKESLGAAQKNGNIEVLRHALNIAFESGLVDPIIQSAQKSLSAMLDLDDSSLANTTSDHAQGSVHQKPPSVKATGWASKAKWHSLRKAARDNDLQALQDALSDVERSLGCSAFDVDGHGQMALHYAAASFASDSVRFLLLKRADPEARNHWNERPIDVLNQWAKKVQSPKAMLSAKACASLLKRKATSSMKEDKTMSNTTPTMTSAGQQSYSNLLEIEQTCLLALETVKPLMLLDDIGVELAAEAQQSQSEEQHNPEIAQPADAQLQPGVDVQLHGLHNASELNGLHGTCDKWDAASGRWHIVLPSGDVKACKAQNIKVSRGSRGACQWPQSFGAYSKSKGAAIPDPSQHQPHACEEAGEEFVPQGQSASDVPDWIARAPPNTFAPAPFKRSLVSTSLGEGSDELGAQAPPCVATLPDRQCALGPLQRQVLREFLRQCPEWKQLDPAQDRQAEQRWAHLMLHCDIESLRQTHSSVASIFRNGEHRGQSVKDLTQHLVEGSVRPSELPPLVAVRIWKQLYVVCGNRRTRALQDARRQLLAVGNGISQVRVIIHEMPLRHLSDPALRCAFLAKITLAITTENGGVRAEFRDRY